MSQPQTSTLFGSPDHWAAILARLKELRAELNSPRALITNGPERERICRIQGNIGALEWVLRLKEQV